MRKTIVFAATCLLAFGALAACAAQADKDAPSTTAATTAAATTTRAASAQAEQNEPVSSFDASGDISVVSREDGSGTRGAFIELFEVEERAEDGSRKDMTTKEAIIADKTDVMMTNISSNPYAIGYISLGSLSDSVKALQIGGVAATVENIKNGSYAIQRPFIIATKGDADGAGVAKDFVDFILSKEGQDVVVDRGCVAIDDNAPAFSGARPSGRIVVAGSSSVHPVMERLIEAYSALNAGATIELQMSDSSAGMTAAMNGTCDIGMASRDLKESELEELSPIVIAIDGIAVIVNNDNPTTGLSAEQVKGIFTGEITKWEAIN